MVDLFLISSFTFSLYFLHYREVVVVVAVVPLVPAADAIVIVEPVSA